MPLVTSRSPLGGIAITGGAFGTLATTLGGNCGGGALGSAGNSVTSTVRPSAVHGVWRPPVAWFTWARAVLKIWSRSRPGWRISVTSVAVYKLYCDPLSAAIWPGAAADAISMPAGASMMASPGATASAVPRP